jgi:hypothetical protein
MLICPKQHGLVQICKKHNPDLQQCDADKHRSAKNNPDLHKTAWISEDLQQHRADWHRSATTPCILEQICKIQCIFAQNSKG